MEMTKRVFKGISGMILMLVASVGITDANAQCTVDMNVQVNATNCFSQVFLSATASDPVVSWNYFIDGSLVGTSNTALLQLAPGVYNAAVAIVTDQGCTAADNFSFTVAGNPLEVNAGSDVVVCQEQAVLSVDINSTNPYEVNWQPAQYLSDPSIETPLVTENVTNQLFIVDVLDLITGCVNSDTILVTQQNPVFDTLDLCDGIAEIDLGQGANYYDWLSWTDTLGVNHPLNVPNSENSITVSEPGQYFAIAAFQECGGLTSLITVETCESQCQNAFLYFPVYNQCEATLSFTGTGTGAITSYLWDFGDGITSNQPSPSHIYTAGFYEVTLITENSEGCIAMSSMSVPVTIGFTAAASEDTTACQGAASLSVSTYAGSGNFSYEWSPQTGLDNPYSATPQAFSVHDQQYIVTVTDDQTGCVSSDSVTVSSYVGYSETLYLCNDSVLIDLGPGALFYNLSPLSFDPNQQSVWTDDTGTYVVYAQFPGCGPITSIFNVEECPTTCSSSISNNGLTYQYCGAFIQLVANHSSPIDSAIWDLGNGTVLVDFGNGIPTQFFEGGNYLVELTAYHAGGCVSTTSYSIILLTDVEAQINTQDTIACAGQLFLSATATGGGGQYTYYWPLSGSTTPNTVLSVTQDQWVVVEVTDTYAGCTDTDSVFVYANQQINETVQMCQPTVPLSVDPGSLFYNWSFTDQSGTTTSLAEQSNQLEATELGIYTCFTYYSGCLGVEHTFEVVNCGTVCTSEFITFENPQSCGVLVDFAGQNFSSPVDSVVWSYGDGQTYTDTGVGALHFYGPGTYVATMTAYHSNGCVSDFSESITVSSGLSVELIEDTLACNGTLVLSYILTGGSGNYTYDWWPAALMSDPTAANPLMTVQYNTWVDFTITDVQTGCTAVDSMYVYANEPVFETVSICSDSVQLVLNPGSMVYNWSYTDEFGNSAQLQNYDNDVWVDEPGSYICLTYYSGCNTVTHSFIVEECVTTDDVWPGDANSDNIVTNADALYLGLAFNQMGPVRPAATINWVGQACPDWIFNFSQNNVNLKHADCDGNGIINFDDTLAISFNYLNTHNKFETPAAGGNPLLWIEATPDTVGLEQVIDIVVHLGSPDQPVDSLHGVAFSLTFNEALVTEAGLSLHFENCVLGTAGSDVITVQKAMFSNGAIDVAITRNTGENFNGYGPIAHARIVTTDNLSGVHDLPIALSGVFALTASETEVALTTVADTVVIDPNKVGITEQQLEEVLIYPNPNNGIFWIKGIDQGKVSVFDALGQIALTCDVEDASNGVDMSALPAGVYMVRVESELRIAVRRIQRF